MTLPRSSAGDLALTLRIKRVIDDKFPLQDLVVTHTEGSKSRGDPAQFPLPAWMIKIT